MAKKRMSKLDSELPQKIRDGEVDIQDLTEEEKETIRRNSNLYKTTIASRKNKDGVLFECKGRPTKAQIALIERYKINHPNQLVKNTVSELVTDELPRIKEAIENIEKYGDINIYSMLPKDLDEFIRDYHLIITDYFGRTKKDLLNTTIFVVPENYKKCNKCKKYKNTTNFYTSNSDISDGYTSICRDCANELFKKYFRDFKNIKETLLVMAQKLDMFVYEPIFSKFVQRYDTEEGKQEVINGTFLGNYIGENTIFLRNDNVNEEYNSFSNTYLGGIPFKDSQKLTTVKPIYDEKTILSQDNIQVDQEDDDLTDSQIKKLKRKWGLDNKDELIYIQMCEDNWYNNYEVTGSNREVLVEQMCYEQLEIWKLRKTNADATKRLKNLTQLMEKANLTPKKTKLEDISSMFSSMAETIKTFEKTKPIINKDITFEDVDRITRIENSMSGALHRTLGIESEYVKEFEENYKEHTVDMEGAVRDQ